MGKPVICLTALLVLSAIALPGLAAQSPQGQFQIRADQSLVACHKHPDGHQAALQ
jgi:hypothetical protein